MRTNQAPTAVRLGRSLTQRSRRWLDMPAKWMVGLSCGAIGRPYLISIMLTISIIVRFGMPSGLQSAAAQYIKMAILIADGAKAKPKIFCWTARELRRRETDCPSASILTLGAIHSQRFLNI